MNKRKIIGLVLVSISILLSLVNVFSVKITGAVVGINIASSLLTIITFVFFFGGLLFLSSLEKKLAALAIGAGVVVGGIGYKIHSDRDNQYIEDTKIISSWKTEKGKFERTYRWDETLDVMEEKYKIPKGILKGLAMRESYGDPLRLNEGKDGGAGLFMFQPGTAIEMGLKVYGSSKKSNADYKHGAELRKLIAKNKNDYKKMAQIDERFDVEKSADAAARYLKKQYNRYHPKNENSNKDKESSWNKALSAYNQGFAARNPLKTKHVQTVREYQRFYNKRDKRD